MRLLLAAALVMVGCVEPELGEQASESTTVIAAVDADGYRRCPEGWAMRDWTGTGIVCVAGFADHMFGPELFDRAPGAPVLWQDGYMMCPSGTVATGFKYRADGQLGVDVGLACRQVTLMPYVVDARPDNGQCIADQLMIGWGFLEREVSRCAVFCDVVADAPIGAPPNVHRSCEASYEEPQCLLDVAANVPFKTKFVDLFRYLPEWPLIESWRTHTVLEGIVLDNDELGIAVDDFSFNHLTHDFTFGVAPDDKPQFRNLRVIRDGDAPDAGGPSSKSFVTVEWESGVGDTSPQCRTATTAGRSCGLFSAGHERHQELWNWPTAGDWVHVEGRWVFDRGHPPAHSEIHPPRLVAVRRALPAVRELVRGDATRRSVFATRVDVFASGDGGAWWNNRTDLPIAHEPVLMNDRDYELVVPITMPRPGAAQLVVEHDVRPGDTFAIPIVATPHAAGDDASAGPHVHLRIPWQSQGRAATDVLARSLYAYWDGADGLPLASAVHQLDVRLTEVHVVRRRDLWDDGELTVFANLGTAWRLLNEDVAVSNVLEDGLGDAGNGTHFAMQDVATTVTTVGDQPWRFWVGGRERDGVSEYMGQALVAANAACTDETRTRLDQGEGPFNNGVYVHGCKDDSIGEVEFSLTGDEVPSEPSPASSRGGPNPDECVDDGDPTADTFRVAYQITPRPCVRGCGLDDDGDGARDDVELGYGAQPGVADSDGDGVLDGREIEDGTFPFTADSDGDGVPDGSDPTPRCLGCTNVGGALEVGAGATSATWTGTIVVGAGTTRTVPGELTIQ